MKELGKIFDSSARVKIMRLFLFNEETPFDIRDIAERSKVNELTAKKEVNILYGTGFLRKRNFTKEIVIKPKTTSYKVKVKGKRALQTRKRVTPGRIDKKKAKGWVLNQTFPLVEPLKSLLIDSELVHKKELPARFNKTGKIKMIVLSGIFMKDDARKVDVLIVGDKLNLKKIHNTMGMIEAEVGKELRYSVFTPEEFKYRLDMYDQHLLDIFEYPHERVVDKLGLVQ